MSASHTQGPWELEETEEGHEIRMGTATEEGRNAREEAGRPGYFAQHVIEYQHGCEDPGEEDPDEPDTPGEALWRANGRKSWLEAEANARLIAAAPDLLDALKAVEWGDREGLAPRCPACGGVEPGAGPWKPARTGHEPDCVLAAALAKAGAPA